MTDTLPSSSVEPAVEPTPSVTPPTTHYSVENSKEKIKTGVLLQLKPDLLGRIDKYKVESEYESRTEAIRQLIVSGLREYEQGQALGIRVERLEEAVKKAGWL